MIIIIPGVDHAISSSLGMVSKQESSPIIPTGPIRLSRFSIASV
ncbi:hypothetical protein RB213_010071 [Colletotrichum asianum]